MDTERVIHGTRHNENILIWLGGGGSGKAMDRSVMGHGFGRHDGQGCIHCIIIVVVILVVFVGSFRRRVACGGVGGTQQYHNRSIITTGT